MSDPLLEGERSPIFIVSAALNKDVQDLHTQFFTNIIGMEANVLVWIVDGKKLGVYICLHDHKHTTTLIHLAWHTIP